MIVEVITAAVCVIAAGFSFKYKRDAKIYYELAKACEDIAYTSQSLSCTQAESAAQSLASCNTLLINVHKAVEDCQNCATNVAELGAHALRSSKNYAVEASEHAAEAKGYSFAAEGHSLLSEKHSQKAEEYTLKAGTLSVAVTKAAQAAAEKSQRQAQCCSCERAVNSYSLRENGDIVCKYCSDRGR